jgi:hypothetical protein
MNHLHSSGSRSAEKVTPASEDAAPDVLTIRLVHALRRAQSLIRLSTLPKPSPEALGTLREIGTVLRIAKARGHE